MTFDEWASLYFRGGDVPEACRDAWNEAVRSFASACEDRARIWKSMAEVGGQLEAEDIAEKARSMSA